MGFFRDVGEAFGTNTPKTYQVNTGTYEQMGKQFFDPNSSMNKGQFGNIKKMGIDSVAQQQLGGMRMGAAGINPFGNEQYKSGLSDANELAANAYNSYLANAYQHGQGLLGMALQGNMQNAQAKNYARQVQMQNLGGLMSNAIGAMPRFLFGG